MLVAKLRFFRNRNLQFRKFAIFRNPFYNPGYRRAFDFEQIDEEFSLNFEHDFQAFIVGYLSENRPLEGARLKSAGEGSGDFEGDQGSPGIARSSVVGQSPVNELEEFNYEDAKGKTSGNEKKLNALAKRCKVNMDK